MNINTAKRLSIALLTCVTAAPAMADPAVKINAANERVRNGDFTQAIEDYSEIPPTEQTRDEVNYNLGVAQYRQGDFSAAKALFSEASTATNSSLAAAARFNLGNCFYVDAVASVEADKQAAIDSLNQAISHYRSSLRANPNHVDARANIELAVELREKLKDELKQEQEKQEQEKQEQQEKNQKQEQDNAEQQDQQQNPESGDSGSQQDQENKDSQSQSGESEENEDQQKSDSQSDENGSESEQSQQQPSGDTKQASENEQSDKNEQSEQSQGSDQRADDRPSPSAGEQQSAGEPSQSEQAAAEQAESSPQEAEAAPSGQLTPANEQQDLGETSGSVAIQNDENALMTKVEALKMLQAVRDRDMLRRLRQEQLERSRHVPTERDW